MRAMKILKARHTLEEAFASAVDFKKPMVRNDRRLFANFAEAAKRFDEISGGVKELCRTHLDIDIEIPTIERFDARAAALPFRETLESMEAALQDAIKALAASLNIPQLGRIEWMDDESCRFTFFEVARDYGIFRNTVRRVAHTHDLVKAKQHRLPADDVAKPKRAIEVIRAIPLPLWPFARVVTGLEILKGVRELSRREEITWLGDVLSSGKEMLEHVARNLADTAHSGATTVEQAMTADAMPANAAGAPSADLQSRASAGPSQQVALLDPAIVIGEFCLYGWED